MNYVIFLKLCDWMQFEVNCAKSYHRVISDGLHRSQAGKMGPSYPLNYHTIDFPIAQSALKMPPNF